MVTHDNRRTAGGHGGGYLLLALPPGRSAIACRWQRGLRRSGRYTLIANALAAYPDGSAFSGSIAGGTALRLIYGGEKTIGWSLMPPNPVAGAPGLSRSSRLLQVRASPLTAGVALTLSRGLLQAAT